MQSHSVQTGEAYWSQIDRGFCSIRCATRAGALQVSRAALMQYSGPELGLCCAEPLNILSNPDRLTLLMVRAFADRPLSDEVIDRRELFAPLVETAEGQKAEVLFNGDMRIVGLAFRQPIQLGGERVLGVNLSGAKLY